LSETVHPNYPGLLHHFTTEGQDDTVHFHDGEIWKENALGMLINDAYHFTMAATGVATLFQKCCALMEGEIALYSQPAPGIDDTES
jgi:hypothetical protein